MALKEIEYKAADGKTLKAAYADYGSVYQLSAKRERFAQQCAVGIAPITAYCEVYGVALSPDTAPEIKEHVRILLNDTTVVLRIQELKKPVLRKLRRRIEYGLQKALEQCEVAYDLAYEQADVKGLLAAVRMSSELSKLLSQELNVNHRYGLLDEASTEVLLEMKKRVEVQQAKQKEKLKISVGKIETVSEGVAGPSLEYPIGSHPEAVPNSESQNFL